MSSALDFPPPPASPTTGQAFTGLRGVTWMWDGVKWTAGGSSGGGGLSFPDAPVDGTTYGRNDADWVNVLPLTGGTMTGEIILPPGAPSNPQAAATIQYVQEIGSEAGLYQGTWQVAANIPNISIGAAIDSTNYLAITANPNIAEQAPVNIPGIGGMMINNGDRIFWASPLNIWQRIAGDGLDLQIGDSRYLQLAGGRMTGNANFNSSAFIGFVDTQGAIGTLGVTSGNDTLTWNTTNSGGGTELLFSVPMHTDKTQLTVGPDTHFSGQVWLSADPTALLEAATKQYVDSRVTAAAGGLVYIGTIDCSTGTCSFTVASGIATPGPVPPANAHPNTFLVCTVAGTIPSGPASGIGMAVGDWLLSDGTFWNHVAAGGSSEIAQNVVVTPSILGATNVQQALTNITTTYLPLAGGTLTGRLNITSANSLLIATASPANLGGSQFIAPIVNSNNYGFNTYLNGSSQWAYLAGGYAGLVYQSSGAMSFNIAPSGSAGAPITSWITPLTLQTNGAVTIGGNQNINYPLQLTMGGGGNANILMTISGVRQWYVGLNNDGQFHIADISAGTDRLIIGTGGIFNLYSQGIAYQYYSGHTFAFSWDGSYLHVIVDGSDVGQYGTIGFNNRNYLSSHGDSTSGSYTFGYVQSTGNIDLSGDLGIGGTVNAYGNVNVSGAVVINPGAGFQLMDGGNQRYLQWQGGWFLSFNTGNGNLGYYNGSTYVFTIVGFSGDLAITGNNAFKPGGGPWTAPSDPRIKTITGDYTGGLDMIHKLRPKRYKYKSGDKEFVGLDAQEVEQAWPSLVSMQEGDVDGQWVKDLRHVDAGEITYALINAVAELSREVNTLKSRLKE